MAVRLHVGIIIRRLQPYVQVVNHALPHPYNMIRQSWPMQRLFAADLIRALHNAGLSPEVEFISITSYGGGTEACKPKVLRDVETDVTGRDVVIIDDILESGGTLKFTRELMLERGANRVSLIALLDKSERRAHAIEADFVGFECPDKFVVGYGMDVGHAFRELPFVGVVTGDA